MPVIIPGDYPGICPNATHTHQMDHIALPQGQRRWWSGYAGFSTAYFLNEAFTEAYTDATTEFFYVEGKLNPADEPSRTTGSTALTLSPSDKEFPQVGEFFHPYMTRPPCGW